MRNGSKGRCYNQDLFFKNQSCDEWDIIGEIAFLNIIRTTYYIFRKVQDMNENIESEGTFRKTISCEKIPYSRTVSRSQNTTIIAIEISHFNQ